MKYSDLINETIERFKQLKIVADSTVTADVSQDLNDFNPSPIVTMQEPEVDVAGSEKDWIELVINDMSPLINEVDDEVIIFDYENDKSYYVDEKSEKILAQSLALLTAEYIKYHLKLANKNVVNKYGIQRNIYMDKIRITYVGEPWQEPTI